MIRNANAISNIPWILETSLYRYIHLLKDITNFTHKTKAVLLPTIMQRYQKSTIIIPTGAQSSSSNSVRGLEKKGAAACLFTYKGDVLFRFITLIPVFCFGIFIGKMNTIPCPGPDSSSTIRYYNDTIKSNSAETTTRAIAQTAASSSIQGSKEMTWLNWPAVAHEELWHPLVFKGDSFVHRARDIVLTPDPKSGKTLLDDFLKVYSARPDKVNVCGIRINHALALFVTVRQLKPTLVVESGVNAGVSTYFIRAAMPDAKIYALDPEEKPICKQGKRWIDPSGKTTYFTGKKFVDLADHNWREMIANGEMIPESTLVFLDDHLHAIRRMPAFIKAGIRHVMIEDNYKMGEGATPQDKKGTPKQAFNNKNRREAAEWLFNNLVSYSEFPPLLPPSMSKESQVPRKPAGGFMVASDSNLDIVGPKDLI